jgi:AhpD family alkylhydroperoxidase
MTERMQLTPEATRAVYGLERYIRERVDKALLELVKLRASMINECAFCVDMHATDALAGGEDVRRVVAVAAWRESVDLGADLAGRPPPLRPHQPQHVPSSPNGGLLYAHGFSTMNRGRGPRPERGPPLSSPRDPAQTRGTAKEAAKSPAYCPNQLYSAARNSVFSLVHRLGRALTKEGLSARVHHRVHGGSRKPVDGPRGPAPLHARARSSGARS